VDSNLIKIGQEYPVLYMKTNKRLLSNLAYFFLEVEMFQTEIVEKINDTFYVQYLSFKNSVVYEVMWNNIVERDKSQMTIWHIHIASWIPKATDTHSEYLILIGFSIVTMVTKTRLVVTLHVYFLCCFDIALFVA
jgi:hypothetical protein